jgi:anthranilate phosphoribosyltransferase
MTSINMKEVLNNLYEHKTLSKQTAKEVLVNIASAKYNLSQVASFMSVFLMRPITVDELSGFREAMLELCLRVEFFTSETIDIVGTGGDGKDTFNISTLSCFIAAGAGVKVTKHGNYGVSSVSGSSNVLEAIGYRFTNDKNVLQRQLDKAGVCFMHAPLFHPAMKNVAPVRKELGVRTFFNMLGPIVNPGLPKYQMLGVYNLEMARLYNYLLQPTGHDYVIVHSFDGYDEISLTGSYKIISREKERVIEPAAILKPRQLSGGRSVEESAKIFMDVLKGDGTRAQQKVVIANAGMAIHCRSKESLADCIAEAQESLESKRALGAYKKLIENNL